jgi:hypothetical protein
VPGGGRKAPPVSVPLISSRESQDSSAARPDSRLENYASLFATSRSFARDLAASDE